MYNFNFKGLMDKYGVEYVAVKSSKHKDTMSPFKEVDTEEIAWMQGIVDHLLDRFIDAVAEGRKVLTRDQVESLADGRLYVAEDARTLGLVDEIGHMKDAVKILSDLAGVTSPAIVEFSRGKSFLEMLGQVSYKMPHLLTGLFLRDTTRFWPVESHIERAVEAARLKGTCQNVCNLTSVRPPCC